MPVTSPTRSRPRRRAAWPGSPGSWASGPSRGPSLCSATVTGLLAGRPRFAFASLGSGAAGGAVGGEAYQVRFDSGEIDFSMPVALAGRQAETARLVERFQEAASGRGGLVMLAGEQGIGKTRLADEVATRAERDGFTVLWGRCHEGESPPPYGPFAEALETHSAVADLDAVAADLGPAAGVVAQVVPGLRRVPHRRRSAPVPPEEERHRLLDGVTRFLVALSHRAPVLMVLDDLHWADRSTVAMLRHLVRLTAPERILVVGTYRDMDLDRSHPLTDAIAAWPREPGYEHSASKGLDGTRSTPFLSALGDQEMEPGWVRPGPGRRGAIPSSSSSSLRHLLEEGKIYRGPDGRWTSTAPLRDLALPVAARDVVTRRLARLSEATSRLLGVAAAFQGAFRFDVAAGVAGLGEEEGLDCLDEAVKARILEPSGDTETYAFTHAVIRHALYDGLVPSRRSRLHRRVAEALRRRRRPPPRRRPRSPSSTTAASPCPGPTRGVEPAMEAADPPRTPAPTTRRPRSCGWPSTCCHRRRPPAPPPRPARHHPGLGPGLRRRRLRGRRSRRRHRRGGDETGGGRVPGRRRLRLRLGRRHRRVVGPRPPRPDLRRRPGRRLGPDGLLRLPAPGGRGPRPSRDPHRQRRAARGRRHPPGRPPRPARPGADGGRLRLPGGGRCFVQSHRVGPLGR